MSGLEFLFRKTLSNPTDLKGATGPGDFKEALSQFVGFCEKQLPAMLEIDFIPLSFDITHDESYIVLGGRHGNIATFETATKKIIRDEEICRSLVMAIVLVADDNQVVVLSSNFELLFLEFPSYTISHRVELRAEPVTMKYRAEKKYLYVSNSNCEILQIYIDASEEVDDRDYKEKRINISDNVVCFDLSDDGSLLALALADCSVRLIHSDSETELQGTDKHEMKITTVCFSEHRRHLAAAFTDFSINVWNVDSSFSLKYTLQHHTALITGLCFARDNRYIISGSKDQTLVVSDMKVERKPFVLNMIEGEVLWLKSSKDHKKVYFNQNNANLMIWDIPQLSKNARYRKHSGTINKILFVPNSFEIISIASDGLVILWDYRNDLFQEVIALCNELTNAVITASGQDLYIVSSKPCIYKMNLSNYKYKDYEMSNELFSLRLSNDESLLVASDNLSRVLVFDSQTFERKYVVKGHLRPVTEVYFLQGDLTILTSSLDTSLGKWELATGNRISTFTGHKSPVTSMTLTPEGWVISASEDFNVIIWNLESVLLYSIILQAENGLIKSVFLSDDNMHMITLQENYVTYWQMYNLSVIFTTDTVYPANCFMLSKDEKVIAIGEGETIYIEENPLRTQSSRIVGKNSGSPHRYMKYILDSIKNNMKLNYNLMYNHWVYTPYLIGIAHILSYSNKMNDLNSALFSSDNPAPFFSSVNNENPLSICTDLAYKNCIDICLKYLRSDAKRNPRAYVPIESCLTKLNVVDLPGITRIYDILFQKSTLSHLPTFCLHETKLPALYHSDQLVIYPENIVAKEFFSTNGRSVDFYQSLCPLDLDIGTNGSIEFLESLTECPTVEIFRSKLLQVVLNNKWDRVKWAVYAQGLLYIIYMFQLSLFCIFFRGSPSFLILLFVAHALLFFYEVTQIATDFFDYWGDMWNILDQLRGFSCTIYAILVWRGIDDSNVLLAVVIFSWTRGISYFRMFDGTRYMVRLLAEVIKDMREFFVILFYSTLAFSFILFLRNPSFTFSEYLAISYRLDLGDFDADYTSIFDWVIFFLATVINPLIMLNLLISIMGDTYAKVQESNDIANYQELTEMIIEIEKLMFWKKRLTHKHYLQQCDFLSHEDNSSDKIAEKLKMLKLQITNTERGMNEIKEMIRGNNMMEIEGNVHEIKRDQEKMKNDLRESLEKTSALIDRVNNKIKIG